MHSTSGGRRLTGGRSGDGASVLPSRYAREIIERDVR